MRTNNYMKNRKDTGRCKEQLVINTMIIKEVKLRTSQLFTVYIDYQKILDIVPHSWLVEVLGLYRILNCRIPKDIND